MLDKLHTTLKSRREGWAGRGTQTFQTATQTFHRTYTRIPLDVPEKQGVLYIYVRSIWNDCESVSLLVVASAPTNQKLEQLFLYYVVANATSQQRIRPGSSRG